MSQHIGGTKISNFFHSAVDLLGKDWLEEKKKYYYSKKKGQHRHHSPPKIIQEYQRALKDLNYEEDETEFLFDEMTEGTLQFIQLGRFYENLSESKVVLPNGEIVSEDIKERYRDKLRNKDEFDKAKFELQAAAGYARSGFRVNFIDEGEEKRPDLLVKGSETDIFVECKKLDKESSEDKKKKNQVNLLLRKTAESIAEESFIGLYQLEEIPSASQAKGITTKLQGKKIQEPMEINLDFGKLKLAKLFPYKNIVETPTAGEQTVKQFKFFYNTYVKNKIKRNFGIDYNWENLTEEQFSTGHVEAEIQKRGVSVAWRNPKFIGAKFPRGSNQIKQILSQFDSAYEKFGKEKPNILHIEAPNLNKLDKNEAKRLDDKIGGQLNVKSRISAVILSTSIIDRKEGITFKQPVKIIENYDPYTSIEADFFKKLVNKEE